MKISVSLPDEDIAALDVYTRTAGLRSRSAAVHYAISLLAQQDLESDYIAAWEDWESSGERAAWKGVVADGLEDA